MAHTESMTILIRILTVVYVAAINGYSFTLVKFQQKQEDECGKEKIRDSKLLITALLGGALGIFISVFVLKYRTRSMFMMVIMPLIAVINAYVVFLFWTGGCGIIQV